MIRRHGQDMNQKCTRFCTVVEHRGRAPIQGSENVLPQCRVRIDDGLK
jgi:hypothetical protein